MNNPISTIIKKIKSKDKELEGMYVAVDDLGNIIGFDKDRENVEGYIVIYNEAMALQHIRLYLITDLDKRMKLKEIL